MADDDAPIDGATSAAAPAEPLPDHLQGSSIPRLVLERAASTRMEITLELLTGYRYRGKIQGFDANMNTTLTDVVVTNATNHRYLSRMQEVLVRGSQIVDIVLPPELQSAYEIRAKSYKRFYNKARLDQRRAKRHTKADKDQQKGDGSANRPAPGPGGKKRPVNRPG
jgi:small nuclear ribonucleoprotein (snRNP)-like protein